MKKKVFNTILQINNFNRKSNTINIQMIYKQSQTKTSDKLLTQSIIYFDHLNKNILRFQQF